MIKEKYFLKEIAKITGYHISTLSKRFTKEEIPKIKDGARVFFEFETLPADIKELIQKVSDPIADLSEVPKDSNDFDAAAASMLASTNEIEGIGYFTRPAVELTAELIDRFISLFGAGGAQNILTTDYCLHPYGTDDPGESDGD